jgi:hypothetical protein
VSPQCLKLLETNFDPVIHIDNVDGGMGARLRYTNDNFDLVAEANPVRKRSCPHWESSSMVLRKWHSE